MGKLKYLNKSEEIFGSQKTFKRITVSKPQGEGHDNSWHIHILLIFDAPASFIENEVIAELWDHDITDTHKVYNADGLALYFKAYLSDVEYYHTRGITEKYEYDLMGNVTTVVDGEGRGGIPL